MLPRETEHKRKVEKVNLLAVNSFLVLFSALGNFVYVEIVWSKLSLRAFKKRRQYLTCSVRHRAVSFVTNKLQVKGTTIISQQIPAP